MKKFIIFIMLVTTSLLVADVGEWGLYKLKTLKYQHKIHGWCTQEKAEKLMDLIYEVRPEVCVEIGVFGGSSVIPTARALSFVKKGVIHAIDPWVNEECLIGYEKDNPNYKWWASVDLEQIYQHFLTQLSKFKLHPYCNVLRMTSDQAVNRFEDESIDILHIDGNHTEGLALNDVKKWLPKVKKGGYIWLDDANWPTTQDALEMLFDYCEWDDEHSVGEDCLLFIKD